jgi:lysophospholipase L1-like esterase
LDCGAPFLTADQRAINGSLMPDAVHPSPAGYDLLAACIQPELERLLAA